MKSSRPPCANHRRIRKVTKTRNHESTSRCLFRAFVVSWQILTAASLVAGAQQPGTARELFRQGLTALHNFEYEDANEAFQRARKTDPGFVLAYWGEALTYHQTLWGHEDVDAGRQALALLVPTAATGSPIYLSPSRDQLLLKEGVLCHDARAVTSLRTSW